MNRSWLVSLLVVVCLLAVSSSGLAAKRDIYVGDIINLKLTTTVLAPQKIKQEFKEAGFEIVRFKETDAGYQLAVRSFELGEKRVKFGGQTVKVKVSSIVEGSDRGQIYSSNLAPKEPAADFPWRYLVGGLLVVIMSGIGVVIRQFFFDSQESSLTPKEEFSHRVNQLSLDSEDYFAKLSLAVKEYLAKKFDCQISGKTTAELKSELETKEVVSQYQADLEEWFDQTAVYKYTPQQADKETKQQFKQELVELVEAIQTEYQAESETEPS